MNCIVCEKEILEGETTESHYGLVMHSLCNLKFEYYDNRSHRATVKCCGVENILSLETRQGKMFAFGKCSVCGKLYITERFPKNPRPYKIHMPKKLPSGGL